jgi:hypothetical protein
MMQAEASSGDHVNQCAETAQNPSRAVQKLLRKIAAAERHCAACTDEQLRHSMMAAIEGLREELRLHTAHEGTGMQLSQSAGKKLMKRHAREGLWKEKKARKKQKKQQHRNSEEFKAQTGEMREQLSEVWHARLVRPSYAFVLIIALRSASHRRRNPHSQPGGMRPLQTHRTPA